MEIVSLDKDTVTIRMKRKTDFLRLYKIVAYVVQEYEKLDETILGLTREEVEEASEALDSAMDRVSGS